MSQDDNLSYRSILWSLYRSKLGLAMGLLAMVALSAIVIGYFVRDIYVLRVLCEALGFSLLATSVITTVQTLVATVNSDTLIRQTILSSFSEYENSVTSKLGTLSTDVSTWINSEHHRIQDLLHSTSPEFRPTHDFPASDEPDLFFNRVLRDDLLSSESYIFRGLSAIYTAVRLAHEPHQLTNTIALLLPDPRDSHSFHSRIRQDLILRRGNDTAWPTVVAAIRNQMATALVGLFENRQTVNCRIVFSSRALDNRIEIFDEALYVTLFSGERRTRHRFPRTLRFNKGSMLYEVLRSEIQADLAGRPTDEIVIGDDPNILVEDFLASLVRLQLVDTGELETYEQLKSGFREFAETFMSRIKE